LNQTNINRLSILKDDLNREAEPEAVRIAGESD
jgi:hypothetical protein